MKRKLTFKELESISGGTLTNRQCMLLGGLVFVSVLAQRWAAAIGVTAGAIIGGCFD